MQHPETHLVTEKHGPRPAGPPDQCFYCQQKIGQHHKDDCVLRERTVMIRYSYTILVTVPESWSAQDIKFHRNNSSWCADNGAREMERARNHVEQQGGCLCGEATAEFVREATSADETKFFYPEMLEG